MQKDWVGWSTKLQEKVDLGVGGPEFQRFAVEKVSGSVFSSLDFTLNSFSSCRWQSGGTSPSTGWLPLPSFSWFTTNISSKIQRFSFVESSPSWDLRRTRSACLAWPDAGLGDFRVFLCFYFSVRFEKFLRKSTPLKKAVFWESTAAKVKLMFTCFLTDFSISIILGQNISWFWFWRPSVKVRTEMDIVQKMLVEADHPRLPIHLYSLIWLWNYCTKKYKWKWWKFVQLQNLTSSQMRA